MKRLFLSFVIGAVLFGLAPVVQACSAYDLVVLADRPRMFLPMELSDLGKERDITRRGNTGTYYPIGSAVGRVSMPNGDYAARFDGAAQYLEVADADALSVPATGVLTLEAWIRPDTLQFPKPEGTGYVHWLGKGTTGQQEYVMRMYSLTNTENRPNRISGYAFNLAGGLGTGSYFQDAVTLGPWVHVVMSINTTATSPEYPTGYVKIFKNGVLRDTTPLNQFNVVPGNGTAPFRVGTRDLVSFFKGSIGKVAVYHYELAPERLIEHYNVMCGAGC